MGARAAGGDSGVNRAEQSKPWQPTKAYRGWSVVVAECARVALADDGDGRGTTDGVGHDAERQRLWDDAASPVGLARM